MLKQTIGWTAAGLAAIAGACAVSGFPGLSVMRAGGDAALEALGPGVGAEVMRDELERARVRLAHAQGALPALDRQVAMLQEEEARIAADLPSQRARLEKARVALASMGPTKSAEIGGVSMSNERLRFMAEHELTKYESMANRARSLPGEIERLRRNREALAIRIAEGLSEQGRLMNEIRHLEARGSTAQALAEAKGTSPDSRGLARRLESYRRSIERAEAVAAMGSAPLGEVEFDGAGVLEKIEQALGGEKPGAVMAKSQADDVREPTSN